MAQAELTLNEALAAFGFDGPEGNAVRFGECHINDTFLVTTGEGRRFILQRVSPVAFHEPKRLMDNVVNVTEYLAREIARQGGDPKR